MNFSFYFVFFHIADGIKNNLKNKNLDTLWLVHDGLGGYINGFTSSKAVFRRAERQ